MKSKFYTLWALALSLTLSACDFSDITIYSPMYLEMYSGDTEEIDAESSSKIYYESDDEYYATVSRSGVITAERVGYTYIRLEDDFGTKRISVEVVPRYTLYTTPLCDEYLTRDDIYNWYGKPDTENGDGMLYYDYDYAYALTFLFDEYENFEQAVIMMYNSYYSKLSKYLDERYWYYDYEGSTDIYYDALSKSSADKIILSTALSSDYYNDLMVQYIPRGSSLFNVQVKSSDSEEEPSLTSTLSRIKSLDLMGKIFER